MIKRLLYESFWGVYLISLYHCVKCKIDPILMSDETAVKAYFRRKTGRELDYDNLISFADKLNWYKLNHKKPLMQQCADKYAVREYVKKCGYPGILNDLYGVYYNVNEIDLSKLPDRFVLKAAHGSHMNIIYPNTKYTWWQCKLLMQSWLKQNIYWSGREWVYKDMPRRLIAERYLVDETGELRDFKLFCYHGKPYYMQVDVGRNRGVHYRNYYDSDLNLLPITDDSTEINPDLTPIDEDSFKRMKRIAEDLSKPFEFVRTDFYLVNNNIYFGEMTFFDGGGYSGFAKEEYDVLFGEPWIINTK